MYPISIKVNTFGVELRVLQSGRARRSENKKKRWWKKYNKLRFNAVMYMFYAGNLSLQTYTPTWAHTSEQHRTNGETETANAHQRTLDVLWHGAVRVARNSCNTLSRRDALLAHSGASNSNYTTRYISHLDAKNVFLFISLSVERSFG